MKEATGELNMTVITVVAIAAVGALFTVFVWPNIQANVMLNTACSQIDADGNYNSDGQNGTGDSIECTGGNCTTIYNNKTYRKTCKGFEQNNRQ